MTRGDADRDLGFWGGVLTLAVLGAGSVGTRAGLVRAMSSPALPARALLMAGTMLCAAIVVGSIVRLVRGEAWAHYPAAAFLLVFLYVRGPYPIGTVDLLPAIAAFFLVPAGFLIWKFSATIRRADELRRHILFESFATAFVVQLLTLMVAGVLTDAGWPRPHPILWAGLLVATWSAALVWSNRRYART